MRYNEWKYLNISPQAEEKANYEGVKVIPGKFLYNLQTDPAEKIDLKKSHPKIFSQLKKKFKKWEQQIVNQSP